LDLVVGLTLYFAILLDLGYRREGLAQPDSKYQYSRRFAAATWRLSGATDRERIVLLAYWRYCALA
jgi:hypothetical protein